jgi:hypothetical protein
LVARINANFDAAGAAIERLQNAARATEGRIAQLAARERALQQQLTSGVPPAQQQQLQKALDDVRQERQQQQRELQQMQGKVKEYYDLQELLESIRAGTDGLRRKAASIPVDSRAATLGAYDAFRQHNRPQWRPGGFTGYRPALKRDVLGRILPKTAIKPRSRTRVPRAYRPPPGYGSYRLPRTPGASYRAPRTPSAAQSYRTPQSYRVPRAPRAYAPRARRSGITPNVPEWKRQVADQQQAAARLRRWA